MKFKIRLSLILMSLVALNVSAQTQMTTSRLYLFNPNSEDTKNSVDALEEAIKTRTVRPSKRIGLIPSTLPDKLGEPVSKSIQFGPVTMNVTDCGNAYGQISSSNTSDGGMLGSTREKFFGCMYISKVGIRLSVILEQSTSSSDGLMGFLLNGIRDGIRGDDQKFGKESFEKMVTAVRQKVPGALIELMELPGGDISRPDGEQVAQLISKAPAKVDLVAPVVTPQIIPVIEAAASPSLSPVNAQVAPARITPAAVVVTVSTPEQRIQMLKSLVELRKSGALTEQEFSAEKQRILVN